MTDPFDIPSRKQTRRKPFRPRCKTCRTNKEIIPILYSVEITDDLLKRARDKEIVLAGNCRSTDAPNWHCKRCGGNFQR